MKSWKWSLMLISLFFAFNSMQAASIVVTQPVSGQHFCIGGDNPPMTIRWTKNGSMSDRVKIMLWGPVSGTSGGKIIVDDTENDGEYTWPVSVTPELRRGKFVVQVETFKGLPVANVFGVSAPFVIESCNCPGTIIVTSPGGQSGQIQLMETWVQGTNHKIRWHASNPHPYDHFHKTVKIHLCSAGQQPVDDSTVIGTAKTEAGEFNWKIPLNIQPSTYYIWVITQIPVGGVSGAVRIKAVPTL